MRIGNMFWGILILLLGVFFLLNQLGVIILTAQFWAIFGAGALILLGVLFIIAPMLRRKIKSEPISIPLDASASAAEIKLRHGAGRLNLHALDQSGLLIAGTCAEGVDQTSQNEGGVLRVHLSAPQIWMPPFASSNGLNWDLGLARSLPLRIRVETGASDNNFDLRGLKLEELQLDTGASSTVIYLPSDAKFTKVSVHGGAASVKVIFPPDVAGRIKVESGLSGVDIDQRRFMPNGKLYETPGFDSAPNRVELRVEMGVGSIEVR